MNNDEGAFPIGWEMPFFVPATSQGACAVLARKTGTLVTAHHRAKGEMIAVTRIEQGENPPTRLFEEEWLYYVWDGTL